MGPSFEMSGVVDSGDSSLQELRDSLELAMHPGQLISEARNVPDYGIKRNLKQSPTSAVPPYTPSASCKASAGLKRRRRKQRKDVFLVFPEQLARLFCDWQISPSYLPLACTYIYTPRRFRAAPSPVIRTNVAGRRGIAKIKRNVFR